MSRDLTALNNFSKNVKKPADITTKATLNNFSNKAIKIEDMEIEQIKLSAIRERQDSEGNLTNEFHEERTDLLEQSIEANGLMNPLILIKLPEMDAKGRTHQIISGHRRFAAYNNIQAKWKNRLNDPAYNPSYVQDQIKKYESIPARVFGLDDGKTFKNPNIPYITEGQEHSIYLETNFETRGLTFSDSLLYIDELRMKLRNDKELKKYIAKETYEKRLEKNPKARKRITEDSNLDEIGEDTFLSYYLSEVMQIKGWSRPSVSRYLYICDYQDKELSKQLKESIKSGDTNIRRAYESLKKIDNNSNEDKSLDNINREGRYQNKIKMLDSICDSIKQKKGKSYTTEQLKGLKLKIQELDEIITKELETREN